MPAPAPVWPVRWMSCIPEMTDAAIALRLMAVDPAGLGAVLRCAAGPGRDRWLAGLRALLPADAPWRRMPAQIADGRLLGGLDLAATLQAGHPVQERGLLADTQGGVLLLAMAERLPGGTAARVAAALEAGGLAAVALDEGIDDERTPAALLDRLAFHIELPDRWQDDLPADDAAVARARLPGVTVPDAVIEALCGTALTLGIGSIRAALLAVAAARASAALDGRAEIGMEDAALAARLVLAPRATILPGTEDAPEPEPEGDAESPPPDENGADAKPMEDVVLDAARAAIPAGLLAQLQQPAPARRAPAGTMGAAQSGPRGRPAGVRAGDPRRGERLSVIDTLRAAAPWQRIRNRTDRIQIRRDDFRVARLKQRAETTTIFVVDASGSQALNRLAEAKGAVELLLAESYVRRDRVAVLAFRGRTAELLLPPTRSLVRAKRSLAGLPGGGGTPLALGIDAGFLLADAVRRRGGSPTLVVLTDGRANVARDGRGGRARAEAEATDAARLVRAAGIVTVLIDSSVRPGPAARQLAREMAARYVPLPYASAQAVSAAVRG